MDLLNGDWKKNCSGSASIVNFGTRIKHCVIPSPRSHEMSSHSFKVTETAVAHRYHVIWFTQTPQISQYGVEYVTRRSYRSKWLKFWWSSQHSITGHSSLSLLTHLLTTHHFYSLNEHACQIPLKVQVTKTIQMPCFFGALVMQRPFH